MSEPLEDNEGEHFIGTEELRGRRETPEVKFARKFLATMNRFGNWDDGCFYYNRYTASELQPLIREAEAITSKEEA